MSILLEKFTSSDYDTLISWVDTVETLMQFAGPAFTFPLTKDQLDKSLSDPKRHAFKIIYGDKERAIGHAEIYLGEESAQLGRLIIGEQKLHGKGIGQESVAQMLDIVFNHFKYTQAALNVFDWNTNAIKCYEKAGFVLNADKCV